MFPFPEGPYRYRPLRRTDPIQSGWDVYALQTALEIEPDGIFGRVTHKTVKRFQRHALLTVDGIAGVVTQRRIALGIARKLRGDLPGGLLKGQIEHESSYWLGNHTAAYSDGARDCGVVQRNTNYTPAAEGFNVPDSIEALASRIGANYEKYTRMGVGSRRAWELAAGSWNAPSWTDRLARGETLSPAQLEHIEAYIQAVTAYARF